MIQYYILDYNFNQIGVVDSYKSTIWTERFYSSGDFEVYVPNTTYYSDLLKLPVDGHSLYILRADDPTKLGIIESIQYTNDLDSGNMILVQGHTDDYLLHLRLILEQVTYSGNIELAVRHMVSNALIHSDSGYTTRESNKISLGQKVGLTDDIDVQYQGQYLDEEVAKLASEYGFGFLIDYDSGTKSFTFNLKKPVDRSLDQTLREPVIFSAKLDNISSSEYNKKLGYTAAYAYGEGSGSYKYVNGYSSQIASNPLERREAHVDANVTSNNGEALDNETLSLLLYQEAKSYVTRSRNSTEEVTAEVISDMNYKLNEDYFLGDIVQVIVKVGDDGYRSFKQRVIEIIESYDENGYACIPTFETIS